MWEGVQRRKRRLGLGHESRERWRPSVRGLMGSLWGQMLGHGRGNVCDKDVRVY
jgi:hypothetical protein